MEIKLNGGRYTAGKYSGLERVTGEEETAQRLSMKLTARRGGFAPLPEYGSRLYTLPLIKASERGSAARQFIAEALAGETDAALSDMSISEDKGVMTLARTFQTGQGAVAVETVFEVNE